MYLSNISPSLLQISTFYIEYVPNLVYITTEHLVEMYATSLVKTIKKKLISYITY